MAAAHFARGRQPGDGERTKIATEARLSALYNPRGLGRQPRTRRRHSTGNGGWKRGRMKDSSTSMRSGQQFRRGRQGMEIGTGRLKADC